MQFFIERTSGTPIYLQLKRQLVRAIAAGELESGHQIPTVRQIAVDTKVDPNTVNRAFKELEREGVLQTQQGRGTFVRDKPPLSASEARRQISQVARRALDEARAAGYNPSELVDAIKSLSKRK